MCQLKRELLCKTGEWYHGHKAQPSLNKQAFNDKLDSIDIDSSDIEVRIIFVFLCRGVQSHFITIET